MEHILKQLHQDSSSSKHAPLRKACSDATDLLRQCEGKSSPEPYQLREQCLRPLQLALESRNNKLTTLAISGMQRLLMDERFQTSMESEQEERWLPMQILNAVSATPTLPEDTQVEVMKVLLNMTFSTTWCMNARVITRIAELCFATFLSSSKSGLHNVIVNTMLRVLQVFYHKQTLHCDKTVPPQVVLDAFASSSQGSVQVAVTATLTQLLTAIAEKFHQKSLDENEDPCDIIAEFTGSTKTGEREALGSDMIVILEYLCKKLTNTVVSGQHLQTQPLLLEGIYAVLCNLPITMRERTHFLDLIWKELVPGLVGTLGNPLADRSVTSQKMPLAQEEVGRGSGCSSTAPSSVHTAAAKIIYNISVELVRLVGSLQSMRPVLESLFHRILHYPPAIHRLEALKALTPVFCNPERLIDLAGPTNEDVANKQSSNPAPTHHKRRVHNDCALLKLIMDSIQECCHCNDSAICITAVNLASSLLDSIEKLVGGEGLPQERVAEMQRLYQQQLGHHEKKCKGPHFEQQYSTDSSSDEEDDTEGPSDHEEDPEPEDHTVRRVRTSSGYPLYDQDELEHHYQGLTASANCQFSERQNARHYVEQLRKFMPTLLDSCSIFEVDEKLCQFSSDICAKQSDNEVTILNADGVYVATYSALLLSLKLLRSGYFESEERSLPMAEDQFVDSVLGMGLLLYLPRSWLSESFQQVIRRNLLGEAGLNKNDWDCPLILALIDLDGLESRKLGGQLLSSFRDAESMETKLDFENHLDNNDTAVEVGLTFSRRVLTTCWTGLLDILSVLVNGRSACGISSNFALMFNAKEESRRARDAICNCLNSLRKAARLACVLGLQDRCGAIFQQLVAASCVFEDARSQGPLEKAGLAQKPRLPRLHAAHAFSMDLVLSIGLEMGSHSNDCWPHVFRCCAHILDLEHRYFSAGQNQDNLPKVQQQPVAVDQNGLGNSLDLGEDLYSNISVPLVPVVPTIDVTELIKQSSVEAGWDSPMLGGGVLSSSHTSHILCGLSQEVDRLFEEAATKLNMKSLVGFVMALCTSSQKQLASYGYNPDGSIIISTQKQGEAGFTVGPLPVTALHLYRLGNLLMKCLHRQRPLLHTMRLWSVMAPHFVEAACHHDPNISKKAVACIHESVTTLLTEQTELPHFHFNESLCKPLENLMCLDLCDGDVQDQIVCSICELVEACTSQIQSGWRSLFGALRAVRVEYTTSEEINEARQRHIAAVLDVFNVFLDTDDVLVFSNAAVDCILCLLKYVRGTGNFSGSGDDDSDSGSDFLFGPTENLCLPALAYLKQCCSILASMWDMPACPIFAAAYRIHTDENPKFVDLVIPNLELEDLNTPFVITNTVGETKPACVANLNSHSNNSNICATAGESETPSGNKDGSPDQKQCEVNQQTESLLTSELPLSLTVPTGDSEEDASSVYHAKSINDLDRQTGVLHVWTLILEGLSSTVAACPRNYQPQTLEMLFELLRATGNVPGPEYSLHCVNHLLLPMLQTWLRHGRQSGGSTSTSISSSWDSASLANFKHCAGMCTDLVVEFIIQFAHFPESQAALELMLKQLLTVLIECIAQPVESVSRLGCACIRHCLVSAGPMLTEHMWHQACHSLQHACRVTLHSLQQLMAPFKPESDNFYGDIGLVRVAVRKDCSSIECERLRQLAQQVFLLDSQRGTGSVIDYAVEEDRSYIFLIYPPGAEDNDQPLARVPFRNIAVGLLSHQLLVQTIGILLLQGCKQTVAAEQQMMPVITAKGSPEHGNADDLLCDLKEKTLPGMLEHLSCRNVLLLLQCLYQSYNVATMFDARPGLKFLIQKVTRADVAANLYKQAGVGLMLYIHALLEICSHQENISGETTQRMLAQTRSRTSSSRSRTDSDADVTEPETGVTAGGDEAGCCRLPEGYIIPRVNGPGLINVQDMLAMDSDMPAASKSLGQTRDYMGVFVRQLKAVMDEICLRYVDQYLQQEKPSRADELSSQLLVFLLAKPDEIKQLKRDKPLKEMVAEKLRERAESEKEAQKEDVMAPAAPVQMQAVNLEEQAGFDNEDITEKEEEGKEDTADISSHKNEDEDKIYTVATDQTLRSLMTEYKKRKQTSTMPTSSFVKATRTRPISDQPPKKPSADIIDRQVEEQQRSSIMKDSEAQLVAWVELLANVLELFHQMPDIEYRALLPAIFCCVNQLVCHCSHRRLRQALAQWTHRIALLCGFLPPGTTEPPTPR